jgi:hypothetical protein
VRALVHSRKAEYVPISLTQIPHLMANGRLRADVAFVQVSPPDAHGFVSLGISVDIGLSVLRYAKTTVADGWRKRGDPPRRHIRPWDRPGAQIFLRPERAAGMHKQQTELGPASAIYQDAGAARHVHGGQSLDGKSRRGMTRRRLWINQLV